MSGAVSSRSVLKTLGWIPVGLFFNEHIYSFATVKGRSMQPTFNPDSKKMRQDVVLLNRYVSFAQAADSTSTSGGWKVGDVVLLKSPINPSTLLVKRIIALPGALVRPLPPSSSPHADVLDRAVRIPPGHCWVEGDEHFHSRDSNTFGAVPLGLLEARVDGIVWPLNRFGKVAPAETGWESRVVTPRTDWA